MENKQETYFQTPTGERLAFTDSRGNLTLSGVTSSIATSLPVTAVSTLLYDSPKIPPTTDSKSMHHMFKPRPQGHVSIRLEGVESVVAAYELLTALLKEHPSVRLNSFEYNDYGY